VAGRWAVEAAPSVNHDFPALYNLDLVLVGVAAFAVPILLCHAEGKLKGRQGEWYGFLSWPGLLLLTVLPPARLFEDREDEVGRAAVGEQRLGFVPVAAAVREPPRHEEREPEVEEAADPPVEDADGLLVVGGLVHLK
jgi:hypothetical protein